MFRIEMLPAAHGDCLWIEYGSGARVHRILIDGGPAHAYPALRERILHLPADARRFELLVITHIDADHIEGVIRLLLDAEALACRFERIWFNGRDQLNAVPDPAGEPLGGVQGEFLGMLIADYEQRTGQAVHNLGFAGALAGESAATSHESLSNRELQVLRLIAMGKSIKEISSELALSAKTVATYRSRIAEKMGLSSNVELTRYAMQHGLVD